MKAACLCLPKRALYGGGEQRVFTNRSLRVCTAVVLLFTYHSVLTWVDGIAAITRRTSFVTHPRSSFNHRQDVFSTFRSLLREATQAPSDPQRHQEASL